MRSGAPLRRAALILLLNLPMSLQICRAQSTTDPVTTGPPSEPASELEASTASAVCAQTREPESTVSERVRRGLAVSACASSAWLDGLFGEQVHQDEYRATHGSVSAGALWSGYDGFDPHLRFQVRLQLPNLDERVSAFVGRLGKDEYVADIAEDEFDALPTRRFGEVEDESALVGLGYSEPVRAGDRFDASVGVRVRLPLDPYARARYEIVRAFADHYVFSARQAVFWRHSDGFGATTHATIDRTLSDRSLLRWSNVGTFSEATQGLEWYTQATLYQTLDQRTGLAWQAQIDGATDNEVDVTGYAVRLIMRRQLNFEWLILELRGGVSWPRLRLDEEREASAEIGAAIEMQFGGTP